MAVFWQFLPSHAPIMLYNIHYWWFFFSQGNWWTKYFAHPKIRRPNLTCWCLYLSSLWMAFTCCCSLSWLLIWLRSEVVDPCFIHCQKDSFLLHWNSCKHSSESSMHCYFWLTVSKRCTQFQHSFLIDKYSCKMVNTLPSDIFNYSAILHNFNLWMTKMSFWSFLVFYRITAEFGWPQCSASFVSVRPRLKSAYHLITIVSNGAESK